MFCARCDLVIDTSDMFEPACTCYSEVENMTDADFREVYDSLPTHLRDYFTPPEPIRTTTYLCRGDECEGCGSTRTSRGVGEYRKTELDGSGSEALINCSDCHL